MIGASLHRWKRWKGERQSASAAFNGRSKLRNTFADLRETAEVVIRLPRIDRGPDPGDNFSPAIVEAGVLMIRSPAMSATYRNSRRTVGCES